MKKKNKNKLLIASAITCFSLLGAMVYMIEAKPQYESAKAITYNEEDNILTLETNDLQNYSLWYGFVVLNNNVSYYEYSVQVEMDIVSENEYSGSYIFSEFYYEYDNTNLSLTYSSSGRSLSFSFTNEEFNGVFIHYGQDLENELAFNEIDYIDITDESNENFFEYLYNYYLSQTPQTEGQSIISAIKDGLGLIGDLASEFLEGFSTLFWNSTAQELTSFGTFALVFLGVAITMAVIKLCHNVLRSNTGA